MRILITGGAGYIGSHTCLELLKDGHEITVVDNLANSSQESLNRVEKLTGKSIIFQDVDLLDVERLEECFAKSQPEAVIHFAGLKAVGESMAQPLRYFHNNVVGTINLLEAMQKHEVKSIIFSSSATVYGDPQQVPITEESPLQTINPYGRTKLMIEHILQDVANAHKDWSMVILRYFNPVGAHESGQIGEDPNGTPNNLFPYVSQVAIGKRPTLSIYGNDYPTPDGTCVRDYMHVVDLALGHVKALAKVAEPGVHIYNLGAGVGRSVLEVVKAFEKACGHPIPYKIVPRRPGDSATCYADASKALAELGWKTERDLEQMCADAWRWQSQYPNGYKD